MWIFLTANYLYCDVFSHMQPEVLKGLVTTGELSGLQVTDPFLLASALLMEIPIAMIVLSRVLKFNVNRGANIIAGTLMAFVQIGTLPLGTEPTLHYLFYSTIEVVCNLIIVWLAWSWRHSEQ